MSEIESAKATDADLQGSAKKGFLESPAGIGVIAGSVFAVLALIGVIGFLATGGGGAGSGPRAGGANALETEITRFLRRNEIDAVVRFDRITTSLVGGATVHGLRLEQDGVTALVVDRVRISQLRVNDDVLERVRIELEGLHSEVDMPLPFADEFARPFDTDSISDAFAALDFHGPSTKIEFDWRYNRRSQTATLVQAVHFAGLVESRITVNFGQLEDAALRDLRRMTESALAQLARIQRLGQSRLESDYVLEDLAGMEAANRWLQRYGPRVEVTGWRFEFRDLGMITAVEDAMTYIQLQPHERVSFARMTREDPRAIRRTSGDGAVSIDRQLERRYGSVIESAFRPRGRLVLKTDFRGGGYPLFDSAGSMRYTDLERLFRDGEATLSNG